MKKFVVFIFICFWVSACTVTGEVDPKKAINLIGTGQARITTESEHNHSFLNNFDRKVGVTRLDGKWLYRMGKNTDFPESLMLTPGRHDLGVRYTYLNAYADGTLWFVAEPEKSYLIKHKALNYSVSFWIVEAETGKIVGGVFGGDSAEK